MRLGSLLPAILPHPVLRGAMVCAFTLICATAPAEETARVIAAGGGWTSNQSCTALSAIAQSCPAGLNTNAFLINQSGFLETFLLFPALDTDQDGIADENDPDDDDDGLSDLAELAGTVFSPATASDPLSSDSDKDGASDGTEARAGTNPQDAASVLRIMAVQPHAAGNIDVIWQSREGNQYELLRTSTPDGAVSNATLVTRIIAAGGTGTWHEASSAATDAPGTNQVYYRVRLAEP